MNGLPSVPSRRAFHPSSDTIMSEFSYPKVIINLLPIISLNFLGKAILLFSPTLPSYCPSNIPACRFILIQLCLCLTCPPLSCCCSQAGSFAMLSPPHLFPLYPTYHHFEPKKHSCQYSKTMISGIKWEK